MKLRNIAAIALCAVMLAAATGCSDKTDKTSPDEPSPPTISEPSNQEPSPSEETPDGSDNYGIDYDAAFAAFAPDTVMISAGDYAVTWDELFFNIRSNIDGVIQNFGEIDDWSEIVYDGMSFADLILNYASENAMMYKTVSFGADQVGAALSPEDIDSMKEEYETAIEQYGGEEGFLKEVWEQNSISSLELYNYLSSTRYLVNAIFNLLYGENGEMVTDEDVAAFTAADGYLMAKHILRMRPEEGEDTALVEIEEILEQLDSYDGEDFEAFFDELMYEYTDDGDGLMWFPNGYLFQYGDMVQEFYDACIALEVGAYSGIVETSYGYHILYREPIGFDEIPYYYFRQGNYTTLRNIATLGMFDSAMYGWLDSLTPVYTDEYRSIDLLEIFNLN